MDQRNAGKSRQKMLRYGIMLIVVTVVTKAFKRFASSFVYFDYFEYFEYLCYKNKIDDKTMELIDIKKPTKDEQRAALESYDALAASLEQLRSDNPQIEIEETEQRIRIPISALKLLAKILKEISLGNPIYIVPVATELTSQAAAEFLGCSRPHIVKLLESGKIPFTKVGKHRRIKYEDIARYKNRMKLRQKAKIQELMRLDEESGMYDT